MLLLLVVAFKLVLGSPELYSGSISFSVDLLPNDTAVAQVELLTGWVLGTGPCGSNCSELDIGRSTRNSRLQIQQNNYDDFYFGRFTTDFVFEDSVDPFFLSDMHKMDRKSFIKNKVMNDKFSEELLDLSVAEQYEQELTKFEFALTPNKSYIFLNFDGSYWKSLTQDLRCYQRHEPSIDLSKISWHMESRMHSEIRNDTSLPNTSPKLYIKPYYRMRPNSTTSFTIPTMDKEGDAVKCKLAKYIQDGNLEASCTHGLTVFENCTVKIETLAIENNHTEEWVSVPIVISEFAKVPIDFGSRTLSAFRDSVGEIPVQVLVKIKDEPDAPIFIEPKMKDNERFIVYNRATWSATIYTKSAPGREIHKYSVISRNKNDYFVSQLKKLNGSTEAQIPTSPLFKYSKQDIVCISAIDTRGISTAEQLCFVLYFKDTDLNYTLPSITDLPHFVDLPSPVDGVECLQEHVCVLPLFVKSNSAVKDIVVTNIEAVKNDNLTNVGQPFTIETSKPEQLLSDTFQIDLHFKSNTSGYFNVCLEAIVEIGNMPDTTCILTRIEPKNPCYSIPCQNSGECKMRDDLTGDFDCFCQDEYYGPLCEHRHDPCLSSPCMHGLCFSNVRPYFCFCTDDNVTANEYEGRNCEIHKTLGCTFERGTLCNWTNFVGESSLDWIVTSNDSVAVEFSQSSHSGPMIAWLKSPVFDSAIVKTRCLSFEYFLHGAGALELNIYVTPSNRFQLPGTKVWSVSTDHGNTWITEHVEISSSESIYVIFEGLVDQSYKQDGVAVTNISVSETSCANHTTLSTSSKPPISIG
ncbi:uncharacterized protein LOC128224578 [Mya arenaria]|uniref:uncharacterized protein LOC128224578 n=1 Tax=Mya arenaria TaxID=6604 RepID=UPI0022E17CDC|nr:uncharacterized protein LOC128224578 [Mya arenaria]